MNKISAQYIFQPGNGFLKDHVLIYNNKGQIIGLEDIKHHDKTDIQFEEGILCPGFINTHCHLELSHMKGKIETGTGLIPFIKSVVTQRDIGQQAIQEAIVKADEEMFREGIVAVGDISNTTDTFEVKNKSDIRYYTFVECFDFMQNKDAQKHFDQYLSIYNALICENGDRKAMVPHAPYSVSNMLFSLINRQNEGKVKTISIHNQETLDETLMFKSENGGLIPFFESFGLSMEDFSSSYPDSIYYAMDKMDNKQRTLFVHNTLSSLMDIQSAHAWNDNVFWATCANANLYIENRLPNYTHFIAANANMTIGTDSLSSNWQLSVLEEMKTISRFHSSITFEMLLNWATINGAKALGFDKDLGSFSPGKSPGILRLNTTPEEGLKLNTTVHRIF